MYWFLKKHWQIFLDYWQEAFAYRAEMILWAVIDSMPMAAMVFLWMGVYRFGGSLGNLSLASLITYYFFGYLLSRLMAVHFDENLVDQVRDGTIARFFIKPISFFTFTFAGELAWKILSLFISVIPISLAVWWLLPGVLQPISANLILPLFLYIVLGLILDCLFSFMVVIGAFYFDQGRALSHVKWIFASLFNGSLLPLAFYPPWMRGFAYFLPFQYQFAVPTQLYQRQLSVTQAYSGLFAELLWLIGLSFLVKFMWRQAAKRFTAVGN